MIDQELKNKYKSSMNSAKIAMDEAWNKYSHLSPIETKELEYWKAQYNQYKSEYEKYKNPLGE